MLDATTVARFRALKPGMELTLTHRYRQPADKLFAALATPERIEAWMGVEWLGDPAPLALGARFAYRFRNADLVSEGRVLAYEPPRLIAHSWFENIPPAATIRWAIEPDGAGCILTLTQSYPGRDDAARNGAGWTMIIGQLDAWLDGRPFVPPESWLGLRDRYAASFGPEAWRDGRRLTLDGRPAVQFRRLLPLPPAEAWRWLAEPARLRDWLGEVAVEPRTGGAFHIRFALPAGAEMAGTITAIDPPRHLALIWREPWLTADEVTLAFDLEPLGAHTLLTLTHRFPAGYDPCEYLEGWHEFMDALEAAIEGTPLVWGSAERKQAQQVRARVYRAIAAAGG